MISSQEGWPTKVKEATSPHDVRLTPLTQYFNITGTKQLSSKHYSNIIQLFCTDETEAVESLMRTLAGTDFKFI